MTRPDDSAVMREREDAAVSHDHARPELMHKPARSRGSGVGQTVLWIIAVFAFLAGIAVLVFDQSAGHAILAAICFVIFTIAVAGIVLARAIGRLLG